MSAEAEFQPRRSRASVSPRQSPSSSIRASISREGESTRLTPVRRATGWHAVERTDRDR